MNSTYSRAESAFSTQIVISLYAMML